MRGLYLIPLHGEFARKTEENPQKLTESTAKPLEQRKTLFGDFTTALYCSQSSGVGQRITGKPPL